MDECHTKWNAYFKNKEAPEEERKCCFARKACICVVEFCNKNSAEKGCKDIPKTDAQCDAQPDCKSGKWSDDVCMGLKERKPTTSAAFNWLWILIIVAIIIIICICIAVCCVYKKKFMQKDSKKDSKHGKYTFGQMNVDSKVKWHGKSKHKKSSGASKKKVGPSSSKGSSKQRRSSTRKPSERYVGAHAGKAPPG